MSVDSVTKSRYAVRPRALIEGIGKLAKRTRPLRSQTTIARRVFRIDVNVPRRDRRRSPRKVTRLIYDRAADSDPLRNRLTERGVELICPHRVNRGKPKLQDGRKLRRYRRRLRSPTISPIASTAKAA